MTTSQILAEISKLSRQERHEIRIKLAELDGEGWDDADDPLSDEDKALIETRIADMEKHPEKSISWEQARKQLESRFGK